MPRQCWPQGRLPAHPAVTPTHTHTCPAGALDGVQVPSSQVPVLMPQKWGPHPRTGTMHAAHGTGLLITAQLLGLSLWTPGQSLDKGCYSCVTDGETEARGSGACPRAHGEQTVRVRLASGCCPPQGSGHVAGSAC